MATKKWYESKALWGSVLMALGFVGQYLAGQIDIVTAFTGLAGALGIAGIRLGNKQIV